MAIGAYALPNHVKTWANSVAASATVAVEKDKDYRQGLFRMMNTGKWNDRVSSIHFTGRYSVWNDGQTPAQADIKEGYITQWTQVPYAKEYPLGRISRLAIELKQGSLETTAGTECGVDAYEEMQKMAFSYLYYGNAASNSYMTAMTGATVSMTGADDVYLFASNHPASPNNSTTWSNYLTGASYVPSRDTLKAAIELLDKTLDGKANKLHLGRRGLTWYVSLQDYPEAKKVLGSDVEDADQQINVYKGAFMGSAINLVMVPWLSHFADASVYPHFLVANDAVERFKPLIIDTFEPYKAMTDVDPRTDTLFVRGNFTQAFAHNIGRGVIGMFPS